MSVSFLCMHQGQVFSVKQEKFKRRQLIKYFISDEFLNYASMLDKE